MGVAVPSLQIPIAKGTSGILLFNTAESKQYEERQCIRCGRCADACAARLMPMLLNAALLSDDLNRADTIGLIDCFECGACSYGVRPAFLSRSGSSSAKIFSETSVPGRLAMESRAMKLVLSGAPHFVTGNGIQKTMGMVIIALLPALAGGVYYFGPRALLVTAASVISAIAAEFLFRKALRRETHITDLSAVVTGMLLALILPVSSPLWMAVVGSAFAIIAVKELFGGLGGNFANPALAGRAVLLMSWPALMTRWSPSLHAAAVDATTTATPLGSLKLGGASPTS